MTSTIESFNLGHTIVMSRGLIDVLPDEASVATMLAQELAHIALGHEMDTQYAFFDRLLLFDERRPSGTLTFHGRRKKTTRPA